MLKVQFTTVAEMKDLVASGDVVLAERRRAFEHSQGRATTLNDDKLLIAIAATDDDDDELFVMNVLRVENDEYAIIGSPFLL